MWQTGHLVNSLILGETQILWSPSFTKLNRENSEQRGSLCLSEPLFICENAWREELTVGQMRQMDSEPLTVGHSCRFCVFIAFRRLINSNES